MSARTYLRSFLLSINIGRWAVGLALAALLVAYAAGCVRGTIQNAARAAQTVSP